MLMSGLKGLSNMKKKYTFLTFSLLNGAFYFPMKCDLKSYFFVIHDPCCRNLFT